MFISVVFLLLVRVCCCHYQNNSTFLHILVVLSVEERNNKTIDISWTQDGDIFHGACVAAQDINKYPDLLQQFEVVPVPVLVPDCDPVKGVHKLLEALLDPSMNVVGVTGMFCDKVAEVYSPIIRLWKRNLLQVLGSSLANNREDYLTSYILPSYEDIAEAVASLLHHFNWTRFGIVHAETGYKNTPNFNYRKLANALKIINAILTQPIQVTLHYQLQEADLREVSSLLVELKSSEANIFVLLVPPKIATSIIQEVVKKGLVWPQYVWIFVHLEPSSISLSPEWENVIFLSYRLPFLNSSVSDKIISVTHFYDNLLYDSVWGLALALNNSISSFQMGWPLVNDHNENILYEVLSNLTFDGRSGRVSFKIRGNWLSLVVTLIKNHTAHVIGRYNFNNHFISLDKSLLQPIPPDRFKFIFLRIPLTLSISLYIRM